MAFMPAPLSVPGIKNVAPPLGDNRHKCWIEIQIKLLAATADTLLTAVSGVNGDGTLAVLTLQGLMAGTTSIDLANVILLDSGLNSIPTNIANGSLTVPSGTVATPEPGSLALLMVGLSLLALKLSRKGQDQPEGEV